MIDDATYTMHTDGGSRGNPGPSAIGFSIELDGRTVADGGWPIGTGTNNEAEYKAVIWGLQNALEMGIGKIRCISDSKLMVNQINGGYKVSSKTLKPLWKEVQELKSRFSQFSIEHVLRGFNKAPDALCNQALDAGKPVGSYRLAYGAELGGLFGGLDGAADAAGDAVSAAAASADADGATCGDASQVADADQDAGYDAWTSDAVPVDEGTYGEGGTGVAGIRGADAYDRESPGAGSYGEGRYGDGSAVDAADDVSDEGTGSVSPAGGGVSTVGRSTDGASGRTVLVGVTGCIAAYKSCEIVRLLQKAGANVKVCMTSHATEFVGPATFRALTGNEVAVELFDSAEAPIHHISLAREADAILVAPCTANVMAKLAYGIADDLLTTTVLAADCPIVVAPAMNTHMWENPKTQESLKRLRADGAVIVEPESGYLSCGDSGTGRLADVRKIADAALVELERSKSMAGTKLLVTSGPTYEPIDPVRFLGNRSSGITGTMIAAEASARGADVVLVTGPVSVQDPAGVRTVHVETAQEMLEAAEAEFYSCDAAVFAAAVSDFRPANPSSGKIKKDDLDSGASALEVNDAGGFDLELVRNPDILKTLAASKDGIYVVGFAAETGNVIGYAQEKLESKNADLIVANDVSDPSLGFGTDDNRVWLVTHDSVEDSGVVSKRRIASLVLDKVEEGLAR